MSLGDRPCDNSSIDSFPPPVKDTSILSPDNPLELDALDSFNPSWTQLLSVFFNKMNLLQTKELFETELLVVPTKNFNNVVIHLSELLTGFQKLVSSSEVPVPFITSQSVLKSEKQAFNATRSELEQNVTDFIKLKKAKNTQSNFREFIEIIPKVPSCARTNPRLINRDLHIKTSVAYNREGPLIRSLGSSRTDTKQPHQLAGTWVPKETDTHTSTQPNIIDRLENVETHLNLVYNSTSLANWKPMDRIRAVEAKIMQLERLLPTWAADHFNQPNRTASPPPPNYPVKDSRGRIFLETEPRPE